MRDNQAACPSQYWFSQSYKGIYSTSSGAERMVFRLATNHHVCGVIDLHKTPSLEEPNPDAPWNMSHVAAKSWIGLIHLYGRKEPYHSRYLKSLGELTKLRYSEPEDYIPWLSDPSNARQDEWLKAREIIHDLDTSNPRATQSSAIGFLELITDQSLTSRRLGSSSGRPTIPCLSSTKTDTNLLLAADFTATLPHSRCFFGRDFALLRDAP